MKIIKNLLTKLGRHIYVYVFIYICLYLYLNLYSSLSIHLYFVFILLVKWICMFTFVFVFKWPDLSGWGSEWGNKVFRPGWQQEDHSCKNADLITWVWIQVFRQLVFLTFKTTSESLINTELSWEEKVFTTPPLDNSKAARVFLQWLEGMECCENHSTGNKADWFSLNFLYPTEAHFTCE